MNETAQTCELYKTHRPTTFDEIVGQDAAVSVLTKMVEKNRVPHAILFSGPSGCGKTTLAYILSAAIDCHPDEFEVIDSGQFKGIDSARELRERLYYSARRGKIRVFLIDEAHQMTSPQCDAMLKVMEDTPKHVYIWLATTDPDKLKKALRTRCTPIEVSSIPPEDMAKKVLWPICVKEERNTDEIKLVLLHIANHCGGSARAALVQLDAVWDLESPEVQLEALKKMTVDDEKVENLVKMLLAKAQWMKVGPALNNLDGEPESIRWGVLGYCSAGARGWLCMNPTQVKRCAEIMVCFEKNYYDSKAAGLTLSCMYACGVL